MNSERLQLKGHISELKQKKRELEIQISGHVAQIRVLIPTFIEPADINSENVLMTADQMHDKVEELKEINRKLKDAEAQL